MKFKWPLLIVAGVLLVTGVLLSFNENVRGAAKLALLGKEVVTISTENETVTVMARLEEGAGFQEVLSLIETEGWILTDQLGSTFVFTRGDESLVLMLKMWTNQYIVAEMTEG